LFQLGWLDVIVSFRFRRSSVSEASKARQLSELPDRKQTNAPVVWLKSAPPGLPILPLPFLPSSDENCNVIETCGRESQIVFASKMMKLPVTILVALH
jgi:hypothetical protein